MQTTQMEQKTTVNGVNVDELFKTIDAVKATPGIARFKFRIDNQWLDGGHNRSAVNNFYGAMEEVDRGKTFLLDADEPPVLLGKDRGANPVEYLLHALAACVTTSMVYHAAAHGIRVEEVESSLEGHIDLRGFLGLDKSVRNGYQNIAIRFRIKGDMTDEQLEQLYKLGPTYSPVYDSVTKGVPVTVTAERMR
ncbi:MAG: OsmC family protein [Bryobacteraceae bacterium]|nr:OsmC family protein [Bryobacteraceae bacterium]